MRLKNLQKHTLAFIGRGGGTLNFIHLSFFLCASPAAATNMVFFKGFCDVAKVATIQKLI
jgi:hypothetical protein